MRLVNPIMRQLQAKTEYELMLRAAKLIVESGVLGNYILSDGTPEKKEEKKSISFRDMAEWWYRVYEQDNPTLKPATSNDYRRMLDKVIYPVIGDKLIHEITTTSIQELLNEEKNMGSSRKVVGFKPSKRQSKIANEGKEILIVSIAVADTLSHLDFVVEALQLARADWENSMGNKAVQT